jgi:hypothetical protein
MAKLDQNSIYRLAAESRVSLTTVRKFLRGDRILPGIGMHLLATAAALRLPNIAPGSPQNGPGSKSSRRRPATKTQREHTR